MSDYSLELNEDQLQIVKWVHEFAENVVRPAGPEWDEREETPVAHHRGGGQERPVLLRLHRPVLLGPDGSAHVPRQRGDELGRRRHRAGHLRLHPGRGRDLRQRDARADRRVDPAVLRHARRRQAGGVRRLRARRRLGRLLAEVAGRLRRGQGRVGAQRHQDVDHQRRHRQHPRARALGRPVAREPGPGQLRRAGGHARHLPGPEVQEDGHPRLAHGRGRPRRLPGAGALPPRRQGEAGRAAGPRQGGQEDVHAGRHGHLRGLPSHRRCAGRRHRPGRLRVRARRTPRSASSSAGPSSRTRPSPSSWPT